MRSLPSSPLRAISRKRSTRGSKLVFHVDAQQHVLRLAVAIICSAPAISIVIGFSIRTCLLLSKAWAAMFGVEPVRRRNVDQVDVTAPRTVLAAS